MPHAPHPGDLPLPEIARQMASILDSHPPGHARVYIKWTCPRCGERCISGTPNLINTSYKHDDEHCGAIYTGQQYGLMVILSNKPQPPG